MITTCIIRIEPLKMYLSDEEFWLSDTKGQCARFDSNGRPYLPKKVLCPIYDCLHSDKESGQHYEHYHRDSRWRIPSSLKRLYELDNELRPRPEDYGAKFCIKLAKARDIEQFATDLKFISNVKYPECIKTLRCPHKGFDLSNEPVVDGYITCPLHGLKLKILR